MPQLAALAGFPNDFVCGKMAGKIVNDNPWEGTIVNAQWSLSVWTTQPVFYCQMAQKLMESLLLIILINQNMFDKNEADRVLTAFF